MDWGAYSGALVVGGVSGGFLAAVAVVWTWWTDKRERTAQELLAEALAIQALKEAWILEGEQYHLKRLSDCKGLPTEDPGDGGLWLRQVEVRAVLDEVRWNTSTHCYYGFINGRRAWIVRDVLEKGFAYPKMQSGEISYHPALISSKGMEELCAWIEKVAGAGSRKIEKFRRLSSTGVAMLDPLLLAVAGDDRIPVFGNRLTTRAKNFLQSYGRDNRVARR